MRIIEVPVLGRNNFDAGTANINCLDIVNITKHEIVSVTVVGGIKMIVNLPMNKFLERYLGDSVTIFVPQSTS